MEKIKIGIILGSIREGRVSPQIGKWLLKIAEKQTDADFEIVDLAEYNLPFYGTANNEQTIDAWKKKINAFDGYIFVVPEYNHSITGVLKNALDLAYEEWNDKAAGIVSYGATGGTRAAEHLRGILAELAVATVRANPAFSIFTDFNDAKEFQPADIHLNVVQNMFDQVLSWGRALKTVRNS